ncbi:hypothetical protein D3C73_1345690 [compost metagenome]
MPENLEDAAAGGLGDQPVILCLNRLHFFLAKSFPAALVEDAVTFDTMYGADNIVKRILGVYRPI